MEKEYNYSEIEKYAKNEMTEKELQSFQEALKTDEELLAEVDFYKQIAEVASLKGLFEEAEEELHQESEKVTQKKDNVVSIRPEAKVRRLGIRKILSYAASVGLLVVAFGAFFANNNYSNSALASLEDTKLGLSTDSGNRSGAGENKDVFSLGLKALADKDLTGGAAFFESVPNSSEEYTEARLYLAYINHQQQNFTAATNNAKIVASTGNLVQKQKAQWLQIQSMLAAEVTNDSFKILLNEVATENKHLFQKEAIQLQQDINSIWRKFVF